MTLKLDKKYRYKLLNGLLGWLVIAVLLVNPGIVQAQNQTPDKPTYIVQPGDTLTSIALNFGVSLTDIEAANGITNPNAISVGMPLVIPGLSIKGYLSTEQISYGQTLTTLSRIYQVPLDTLVLLNHITSPYELYDGSSLIIPKTNQDSAPYPSLTMMSGQSLLEMAVLGNTDPWTLDSLNGLDGTWDAIPGDVLVLPSQSKLKATSYISPLIQKIAISPSPMVQGQTVEIKVTTSAPVSLGGSVDGYNLHFFPNGTNQYVSLQGLYGMATPGTYPLALSGKTEDGSEFNFSQMVLMDSGNYPQDPPLQVDPTTIDPAVTGPEDVEVAKITAPITPDKLWNGVFQLPVDPPICIKSWFGDRRSYNGGPYIYFHTGLDYGVCAPSLHVYAAAPGVVVFTGLLTVRGNATFINHGWGVYTAYYHQSKFLVKVGDVVKAGQQIGVIGATGRVNGPHVHFEVWVNGVQVDPQQWQNHVFP